MVRVPLKTEMGRLIGATHRAPELGWYPLRLTTTIRPLVHGGRRLAERMGRADLPAWSIGEAWEVCDGEGSVSYVTNGRFAGTSLRELMAAHPRELMGDTPVDGSFPLFVKLVDAGGTTPVRLDEPGPGAGVVWHVLDAPPGATIGCGVHDGVGSDQFRDAIQQQEFDDILRKVPVRPGDTIDLPAGTPYSLGAGILLYAAAPGPTREWSVGRWRGEDGTLIGYDEWQHTIEAVIEHCDLTGRPMIHSGRPLPGAGPDVHAMLLRADARLALERWQVTDRATIRRSAPTAAVITNVGAQVALRAGDHEETLPAGCTALVPAAAGSVEAGGPADLLVSYVPDPEPPPFGAG